MRGTDLGGGLGEAMLNERILGGARRVFRLMRRARLLAKCVERAKRDADRGEVMP